MSKLIEKHNEDGILFPEQHANITKEVACGFAEWLTNKRMDGEIEPSVIIGKYLIIKDDKVEKRLTVNEVFDLYIKSLYNSHTAKDSGN